MPSRFSTQFSEAEKRIIAHFGFTDLLNSDIGVHPLYRILCESAFMRDDRTPYANALRVAWRHINSGGHRGTERFDRLILCEIDAGGHHAES